MMIAPDKSSVVQGNLPSDDPRLSCLDSQNEQVWFQAARGGIRGYRDLKSQLIEESERSKEPLYLRKDSHWDSAGSLVAVRSAINYFSPNLWKEDQVLFGGLKKYNGDLSSMLSLDEQDQAPDYSVTRTGVSVIRDVPEGETNLGRVIQNRTSKDQLITGNTLLIYDSFGMAAMPQIIPFFESLHAIHFGDFEPSYFVDAIKDADQVWFLSVERSLGYRMMYQIGSDDFQNALAAALNTKGG
jgi:hypothetical protein